MYNITYFYYLKGDGRIVSRTKNWHSPRRPSRKQCVRRILEGSQLLADVSAFGDPCLSAASQVYIAITAITKLEFELAANIK